MAAAIAVTASGVFVATFRIGADKPIEAPGISAEG